MTNAELKKALKEIQDIRDEINKSVDLTFKTDSYEKMQQALRNVAAEMEKMGNSVEPNNKKIYDGLKRNEKSMQSILLINEGIVGSFVKLGKEQKKFIK